MGFQGGESLYICTGGAVSREAGLHLSFLICVLLRFRVFQG